jgi:hypothetical protein
VLGIFVTVYDFLIRVIPVYVLGVFASLWFSNQGHPCILVWWCGIFYFLFYHIFRFEISKAKQKLCVLPIAWSSKLGSVGRDYFFFFLNLQVHVGSSKITQTCLFLSYYSLLIIWHAI